jgi:hypothetical protein
MLVRHSLAQRRNVPRMKRKLDVVLTLKQARTYILQVGICGIFSDERVGMPNLLYVVDLSDQKPVQKRWSNKVITICY